jgi:hypothetical protein
LPDHAIALTGQNTRAPLSLYPPRLRRRYPSLLLRPPLTSP